MNVRFVVVEGISIIHFIVMINSNMGDILYYYSGSADKPPGSGVNERVSDRRRYSILSSIPMWRQILSNFYVSEFTYVRDGIPLRYRTAEHAFQGAKIAMSDSLQEPLERRVSYQFSLNSRSALSRGDGDAARRARKIVVLDRQQLQKWNRIKDSVLKAILIAKFTQDLHAGRTLIATLDAELWHGAPRVPKSRQLVLEEVRDIVRKDPNVLAYMLSKGDFHQGTDETLQNLIDRNSILSIMSRVDPRTLSHATIQWLSIRGLHPEWFIYLLSGGVHPQDIPSDLWRKYLANAIVASTEPIVRILLSRYRERITPSMVENMKRLSKGPIYDIVQSL